MKTNNGLSHNECRYLLSIYRKINQVTELMKEEKAVTRLYVSPEIFAAFKRYQVSENVISIISDYKHIMLRAKELLKIDTAAKIQKEKVYKLISLANYSSNQLTVASIEKKTLIGKGNFSREYNKAVDIFKPYIEQSAKEKGYTVKSMHSAIDKIIICQFINYKNTLQEAL